MLRAFTEGFSRVRHKRALWVAPITALALLTLAPNGAMAATSNSSTAAAPAAATSTTSTASATNTYKALCGAPAKGEAQCLSYVRTNTHPVMHTDAQPFATAGGYGPSDLQSAYNLASASASDGAGVTVAIVDAYNDPNAASDLSTYRSQFGLPACTTSSGCFKVVSQTGSTTNLPPNAPASDDWSGEESLDFDMVSAICPLCHILLVEATSPTDANLGTAVNEAVALGAKYVSNSYGGDEDSSETSEDSSYYHHPGVAVVASAGDSGYGVEYPAASPYVTSVGGTSLSTSSNSRGWTESVWSTSSSEGTGSGCSAYEPKPSWQTDTGCSNRTVADVSAVADPNTGVAVYDSFNGEGGWNVYGGTSASSPIIAAVYALAGTPGSNDTPASYPYAHTSSLYDVTSGSNGSCGGSYLCTAKTGYDGPTGLGTPDGTAAFSATGGGGGTGNTVTVTNPGSQTGTVGTATSLQISATDSASGQTLTYTASGLPAGLSISSSGLISGTPTTAGTYHVTVTATDGTGASGSATFGWTISSTGGGGCTAAQLLGNPGFETGSAAPWTATSGVINSDTIDEPAHSGDYDAWFDGYGTTHTDTLSQTITIPSTCTTANLSFWLHIDTDEYTTTTAYDTFKVQVLSGSTVLGTLATFSNLDAADGYTPYSYSLAPYIGQTITLKFTGSEDSSLQTSFVLDDTAANVD
jgi:subtilase family serine protease